MAKYDPLRDHLDALPSGDAMHEMTFSHIDAIVGGLPPSARRLRQWWANDSKVEARAWRAAGWHVDAVDLNSERVRFTRGRVGGTRATRLRLE